MTDFNSNTDDIEFITNLFTCLGTVVSTEEKKMHAVTSISGSGPAYVFLFLDCLIDAGVKQGLTKDEAKILAIQTVKGSAVMAEQSDKSIPELVQRVCSKGGTTIEAVKVFEEKGLRTLVEEAVEACANRSKELAEKV
jgi:pyrroline-5-carboxylate reductase